MIWVRIREIRRVVTVITIIRCHLMRRCWIVDLATSTGIAIFRAAVVARLTITGDTCVIKNTISCKEATRNQIDVAEVTILCRRQVRGRVFCRWRW